MPYIYERDFSGGINDRLQARLIQNNQFADLDSADISIPGQISKRPGFLMQSLNITAFSKNVTTFRDSADTVRVLHFLFNDAIMSMNPDTSALATIQGAGGSPPYTGRWWFAHGVAATTDEVLFMNDGTRDNTWWTGPSANTTSSNTILRPKCLCWFRDRLWYSTDASPYSLNWSDYRDGTATGVSGGSAYINEGDGDIITAITPTRKLDAGELIIAKKRSVYAANILFGNFAGTTVDSTNSYVRVISNNHGVIAPHSGAWLGDDYVFLAHDGVRRLSRAEDDTLTSDGLPISLPVQSYIDRINFAAIDNCCGHVHENKYYLTVPLDDETEPTHTLIYDAIVEAWMVWEFYASDYTTAEVSGLPMLFFTRTEVAANRDAGYGPMPLLPTWQEMVSLGRFSKDLIYDDFQAQGGVDLTATVETKAYDADLPHVAKQWLWLELRYKLNDNATSGETITIWTKQDGSEWVELRKNDTLDIPEGVYLPQELPCTLGSVTYKTKKYDLSSLGASRDLQLKFSFWGQGGAVIYDYVIRYEPEGVLEETQG